MDLNEARDVDRERREPAVVAEPPEVKSGESVAHVGPVESHSDTEIVPSSVCYVVNPEVSETSENCVEEMAEERRPELDEGNCKESVAEPNGSEQIRETAERNSGHVALLAPELSCPEVSDILERAEEAAVVVLQDANELKERSSGVAQSDGTGTAPRARMEHEDEGLSAKHSTDHSSGSAAVASDCMAPAGAEVRGEQRFPAYTFSSATAPSSRERYEALKPAQVILRPLVMYRDFPLSSGGLLAPIAVYPPASTTSVANACGEANRSRVCRTRVRKDDAKNNGPSDSERSPSWFELSPWPLQVKKNSAQQGNLWKSALGLLGTDVGTIIMDCLTNLDLDQLSLVSSHVRTHAIESYRWRPHYVYLDLKHARRVPFSKHRRGMQLPYAQMERCSKVLGFREHCRSEVRRCPKTNFYGFFVSS